MKTVIFCFTLLISAIGLNNSFAQNSFISKGNESTVWFPEGTRAEMSSKKTYKLTAPPGWEYAGINAAGDAFTTPILHITCTSCVDNGGGCDPVLVGGKMSCLPAGCTGSCRSKPTLKAPGGSNPKPSQEVEEGGFIKSNARVTFATASDLERSVLSFHAMYELPKVKSAVESFLKENAARSNERQAEVIVNIAGRIAVMKISYQKAILNGAQFAKSVSCSCVGSGSCPKRTVGNVVKCDNGCSHGCSMDIDSITIGSNGRESSPRRYTLEGFKF